MESVAEATPLLGAADARETASTVGPLLQLSGGAERAHHAAVRSLDEALWPTLERALALEHLANHQERELKSKKLGHAPRLPVDAGLVAFDASARDGAYPESLAGRHLAAHVRAFESDLGAQAPIGFLGSHRLHQRYLCGGLQPWPELRANGQAICRRRLVSSSRTSPTALVPSQWYTLRAGFR